MDTLDKVNAWDGISFYFSTSKFCHIDINSTRWNAISIKPILAYIKNMALDCSLLKIYYFSDSRLLISKEINTLKTAVQQVLFVIHNILQILQIKSIRFDIHGMFIKDKRINDNHTQRI